MYNINFKVKYHDIETELLDKLKQRIDKITDISTSNQNDECIEEYDECIEEYSRQDIIDICEKLYKDELLSVFEADNITDKIIISKIKDILPIMLQHDFFKESLTEIKSHIIQDPSASSTHNDASNEFIFFAMFAHQTFHITHKCICSVVSSGMVDEELLANFTQSGIEMFASQK